MTSVVRTFDVRSYGNLNFGDDHCRNRIEQNIDSQEYTEVRFPSFQSSVSVINPLD